MASPTPDLAAVEERLETLEREVLAGKRRTRWLLVAVGLAAVASVLPWTVTNPPASAQGQAANTGPQVIRATQFILEDEHGRTRAKLFRLDEGPMLALVDEKGTTRAVLAAAKTGPALSLHDEIGRPRVALWLDNDAPMLSLTGENGTARVGLSVNKNAPRLVLVNEKGKTIWTQP